MEEFAERINVFVTNTRATYHFCVSQVALIFLLTHPSATAAEKESLLAVVREKQADEAAIAFVEKIK